MKLSDISKKNQDIHRIVMNYKNIIEIGQNQRFCYINTLCISHNQLQNLEGIEQFVQLKVLSLHHNNILSVNELFRLQQPHLLKQLNIHHNPFAVNPTHTTKILEHFRNLEQLDIIHLNKQNYTNYFHWIETIGSLIVPFLNTGFINQNFIKELQYELKKYDPCIFALNKIIYSNIINTNIVLQEDNQKQENYSFKYFKILLNILENCYKNRDLKICLMNQAMQQIDIDLFEFQSDSHYQLKQLYKQFIQLKQLESNKFIFPYFPLNFDYIKSIIDIFYQQYKNQNKCIQTTQNNQSNNNNQENITNNIFKPKIQLPMKQQQQINKYLLLFDRVLSKIIVSNQQNLKKTTLNKLKFNNYLSQGIIKLNQTLNNQFIKNKQQLFQLLKLQKPVENMINKLQLLINKQKDDGYRIIVRVRKLFENKQIKKAENYERIQKYKRVFITFLINQQQQVSKKQIFLKLLIKQRLIPLSQYFSRWKLFCLNEQFYEKVFPSGEIKSLASITTKEPSKYNKSVYIIDSNTTLDQELEKGKQRFSNLSKQIQPNNNNIQEVQHHNLDNNNNNTTIYCEYVIMKQVKKKKKSKKSKKLNNNESSKIKKKEKNNNKNTRCKICKDYLDENGQIKIH